MARNEVYRIVYHRRDESPVITHPGAAVDEGACDLQHVCVLSQLQAVPLQLLLVPRHLTQLHLQPLELLLQTTSHSDITQ